MSKTYNEPFKCSNPMIFFDKSEFPSITLPNYVYYSDLRNMFNKGKIKTPDTWNVWLSKLIKERIYQLVRCRKCQSCINFNRYLWTQRVYEEALQWDNMYFITLTYNEQNVPLTDKNKMTLDVKDYQKFFKKLRKYGMKFKYIISGEYGPRNKRPHYHIIFLTNDRLDLYPLNLKKGVKHRMYYSKLIDDKWNKGFHSVEVVDSIDCVSYLTLYSCKALTSQDVNYRNKFYYYLTNKLAEEGPTDGDCDVELYGLYNYIYEERRKEFCIASKNFTHTYRNKERMPTYLLRKIKDVDEEAKQIIEKRIEENYENLCLIKDFDSIIEKNLQNDRQKKYKTSKNDV